MTDFQVNYDKIVSLKSRYASYLVILEAIIIIVLINLNNSIKQNALNEQNLLSSYNEAGNKYGKFRSYKTQSSEFYTSLIFNSIYKQSRLFIDTPLLSNKSIFTNLDYEPTSGQMVAIYRFHNTQNESNKLGILCANLNSKNLDSIRFLNILINSLDTIFTDTNVIKFLSKHIIPKFINIFNEQRFDEILSWIIFDEWPPIGGGQGRISQGTSYVNRFHENNDNFISDFLLYKKLKVLNLSEIDSILFNDWDKKCQSYIRQIPVIPSLSIANVGVNIDLDIFVLFIGPLLLLFQTLFFTYWHEEQTILSADLNVTKLIKFPDFQLNSKNLLLSIINCDLIKKLNAIIWILFLVTPSLITYYGLLTRYDFYSINDHYSDISTLSRIISIRSRDFWSLFIDIINLLCFATSIYLVMRITISQAGSSKVLKHKNNNLIEAILVLLIYIILISRILIIYHDKNAYGLIIILSLVITLFLLNLRSYIINSKFIMIYSFLLIVIIILLDTIC